MAATPTGRLSWRSTPHDFAYLIPGFFVSLIGFIVLLPLFTVGLSTAIIWIGAPILGFTLLLASSFARENRELLRRWNGEEMEPAYRVPGTGISRMISMLADAQMWKELFHAILVAFPLRITTFVLAVTWPATALAGLTYFLWAVFLPGNNQGLADLLLPLAYPALKFDPYIMDSIFHFVIGFLVLLTTPAVVRVCCLLDAAATRVFLGPAPRLFTASTDVQHEKETANAC